MKTKKFHLLKVNGEELIFTNVFYGTPKLNQEFISSYLYKAVRIVEISMDEKDIWIEIV